MTAVDKLAWIAELAQAFADAGLPVPELEFLSRGLAHAYVHCLGKRVYLGHTENSYHVRRPVSGNSFSFGGSLPGTLPEACAAVAKAFKEYADDRVGQANLGTGD